MTEHNRTIDDYSAAVCDLRDELARLIRKAENARCRLAAGLPVVDLPHGERVAMAIGRVNALAWSARRATGDEAAFLALHTDPDTY